MKSITNETQVNENRIVTIYGPNKINKDLLELRVYDDGGNPYTIGELFDELIRLKDEVRVLNKKLNAVKTSEDEADKTITGALDIMALKISQLEMSIKELENKKSL